MLPRPPGRTTAQDAAPWTLVGLGVALVAAAIGGFRGELIRGAPRGRDALNDAEEQRRRHAAVLLESPLGRGGSS